MLRFGIPEFRLDRVLELRENYVRLCGYNDIDWLIQNALSQHGCLPRMQGRQDGREHASPAWGWLHSCMLLHDLSSIVCHKEMSQGNNIPFQKAGRSSEHNPSPRFCLVCERCRNASWASSAVRGFANVTKTTYLELFGERFANKRTDDLAQRYAT